MQKLHSLCACVPLLLSVASLQAQGDYPLSIPPPEKSKPPALLEVLARDKTKLKVHVWEPNNLAKTKHVVLFIHGIALHGKPYEAIAAGFTTQDMVLVCPDLRGHGLSKAKSADLARVHVLRADIGAVIGFIHKRYPGAAVVLAGESMGALIAADYASRGEQPLAGLVLLAPAFAVHPNILKKGPALTDFLWVDLAANEKLEPSTRNEGFIKARQQDKLAYRTVPPAYLLQIAFMQAAWPAAAAEIKVPVLVAVAGDDRIINNKAVKKVFEQLGTPKEQKEWKELKDAKHTLCWDNVTRDLVGEVTAWIRKNAERKDPEKEPRKKKCEK